MRRRRCSGRSWSMWQRGQRARRLPGLELLGAWSRWAVASTTRVCLRFRYSLIGHLEEWRVWREAGGVARSPRVTRALGAVVGKDFLPPHRADDRRRAGSGPTVPLQPSRRGCRRDALQLNEAAHVVGEVLQADPGLGADQADAAHQRATHVVRLGAEHVLDAGPHLGTGPVALLLAFAERPAATALAVDPALQALLGQLRLDRKSAG